MANNQTLTAQSLPIVYCKGSYYEVGYCIGHTFSRRINDWFADPLSPIEYFRKIYQDEEGHEAVMKYLERSEEVFPEYVQEMRGIVDGSGAKFEDILLQNVMTELYFAHPDITERLGKMFSDVKHEKEVAGCTSVYVNRSGARLLAHNEDGEIGAERYNYLAAATIIDESEPSKVKEEFITFMYPGMVPGFAFNVSKEFVITGNTLVPKSYCHSGVPTSFVIRKILACRSIEEMTTVAKCEPYGCAYGFNLNIASVKGDGMWSMEVLPGEEGSRVILHKVQMVSDDEKTCHYFHLNFYKHVKTEELPSTEGTLARGKRCNELPPPRNAGDITRILGDTENKKWPIYRGQVEKKCTAKTVCTALFDITEKKLHTYLDNPKNNKPFATIDFSWMSD